MFYQNTDGILFLAEDVLPTPENLDLLRTAQNVVDRLNAFLKVSLVFLTKPGFTGERLMTFTDATCAFDLSVREFKPGEHLVIVRLYRCQVDSPLKKALEYFALQSGKREMGALFMDAHNSYDLESTLQWSGPVQSMAAVQLVLASS